MLGNQFEKVFKKQRKIIVKEQQNNRSCVAAWVRMRMRMSDTTVSLISVSCYNLPEAWALIPAVLSSLHLPCNILLAQYQ